MYLRESSLVEIYTDGACRGNPGPGGWAALLRFNDAEKIISGAEEKTTNNRMELMAAIHGLEALSFRWYYRCNGVNQALPGDKPTDCMTLR